MTATFVDEPPPPLPGVADDTPPRPTDEGAGVWSEPMTVRTTVWINVGSALVRPPKSVWPLYVHSTFCEPATRPQPMLL